LADQIGLYSVAQRRREKQISRDEDCARLSLGQISPDALRYENGIFSDLNVSGGRLVNRRARNLRRLAAAMGLANLHPA